MPVLQREGGRGSKAIRAMPLGNNPFQKRDFPQKAGEELISLPIKMPDCHNCATKKTNHPHEGHLLLIIKCFLSGTSSTVLSAEKLIMVRLGLVWFSLGKGSPFLKFFVSIWALPLRSGGCKGLPGWFGALFFPCLPT